METVQHRHNETGVICTEISRNCFVSVVFDQLSDYSKTSLFLSAVMLARGLKM